MSHTTLHWTRHAARRLRQRAIDPQMVVLALQEGQQIDQDGASLFFLGHRQVRRLGLTDSAAGLTVVLSRDHAVLTAYRGPRVPRRLRRRGHRSRAFTRRRS
jgi:hypothetical protein